MIVPKTLDELNQLKTDDIEESIDLEYKSAEALFDLKEISKDVSAMANSAGGIIIYGLKEYDNKERKHKIEKITPIIRKDFTKEKLEQIINGNISPRLDSMRIHPISLSESEVVYVVEIPQSNTAHQNTKDFRYYRRYNFESVPMLDFEIRDIMNRSKHPIVKLEFEIIKKLDESFKKVYKLKIYTINSGEILTRFINYFVKIPSEILDLEGSEIETEMIERSGDNIYKNRFVPLLPGVVKSSMEIDLISKLKLDEREIYWRVQADNASPQIGSIKLKDIIRTNNIPPYYE